MIQFWASRDRESVNMDGILDKSIKFTRDFRNWSQFFLKLSSSGKSFHFFLLMIIRERTGSEIGGFGHFTNGFFESDFVRLKVEIVEFDIEFALETIEEFLGVRSDLGTASGTDKVFDLFPVFAEFFEAFDESVVLLLGPTTSGFGSGFGSREFLGVVGL